MIRLKKINKYILINIVHCVLLLVGSILFFFFMSKDDLNYSVLSILLIFISQVIFCLIKYEQRIAYLLFLASFFIFLLGRMCVEYFYYGSIGFYFTLSISKHMLLSIFISLIFLEVGYCCILIVKNKYKHLNISFNDHKRETEKYSFLMRISFILFSITFICVILMNFEQVIYVNKYDYIALFKDFHSQLPRLLQVVGNMYIVSFLIFLGTCPKRRYCIISFIMFFIISLTDLLIGDRGTFIINLAIIIVYIFWRECVDNKIWINRKIILLTIVILPLFLAFLNYFVSIREDVNMGENKISAQLRNFFISTGSSVDILGYGEVYKDDLPQSFYSFGELIDYPKYNPISEYLFNIAEPMPHTKEYVYTMHSYAHAISYFIDSNLYLEGHGKGSSYIAEVYNDFGYIGIIVCNLLYGSLLASVNLVKKGKPFLLACLLISIRIMFYVPRGAMIQPISYVLNITTLSALFFFFIAMKNEIRLKTAFQTFLNKARKVI